MTAAHVQYENDWGRHKYFYNRIRLVPEKKYRGEVLYPDGTSGWVDIVWVEESFDVGDMGHTNRVSTDRGFIEREMNGVKWRVPLESIPFRNLRVVK